jgi:hypothetical protein
VDAVAKIPQILGIIVSLATFLLSGCGYGFRSGDNIWAKEKVRTVYVQALENNTLHAGIETIFTSAIIKEFSQGGRITLVSNPNEADATIEGAVDETTIMPAASTTADQVAKGLPPGQGLDPTYVVAQEYVSTARITLRLKRKSDGKVLWSQSFGNRRLYPAENKGGDIGNTGVLVNESRWQMSLQQIANAVAIDAHDLFFESF